MPVYGSVGPNMAGVPMVSHVRACGTLRVMSRVGTNLARQLVWVARPFCARAHARYSTGTHMARHGHYLYRVAQKNSTTLKEHNFKTAQESSIKLQKTLFSTCSHSHWEFSMPTDNKRTNDSCLKVACPKIQYRGYQQYWMCTTCTLHGILLW